MEDLLSELKTEVYADKDAYIDNNGEQWYSGDDDDGYADWKLVSLEQVTQVVLPPYVIRGTLKI